MAEKNPSGLQVNGVVGTDRVSLTWLPPYDAVKKYNVYMKKIDSDKYELIDSTGGKSITLKNLSAKTAYFIIVTSVDGDSYESSPSNELKVITSAHVEVQQKDGKVFNAYLITEDKDGYTFRNDLERPEDFNVKRSDVQYITGQYPSALRGTAGTGSIELKWFAPYETASEYNIYTKRKGEEYQTALTSGSNFFTLKGLGSNTEYTVKVTAIGKDKTESKPSNELKIVTKNILPDQPVISSTVKPVDNELSIIWNAAADPDGKIEKYRIYGTKEDKRVLVADSRKTEYTLKDSDSYNKIELVSVDDKGDESLPVRVSFSENDTVLGFYPGVIYPIGKFGDMAEMGYGGMFAYTKTNMFFRGSIVGGEAGFYYLSGKDIAFDEQVDYSSHLIFPLLARFGYSYEVLKDFSIILSVSPGFAWVRADYIDKYRLAENDKTSDFFDIFVKAGLSLEYRFNESLSVSAKGEYGALFEIREPLQFAIVSLGAEYRF